MGANSNGTPTPLGIPTLNPGQDIAGPLGVNEIVAVIDSKLTDRMFAPSGALDKQVVKWSNVSGAWVADYVKPSELAQEAAADGQGLVWSTAQGKWVPGSRLLGKQVLGGVQASFDTTTILGTTLPQTYNGIRVIIVGRNDTVATSQSVRVKINNDATAADYSASTLLSGTTAAAAASTQAATTAGAWGGNIAAASLTAGIPSVWEFFLPAYALTTFFKTWKADVRTPGVEQDFITGDWASTAAVTQLTIAGTAGNWIAGSSCYIYGEL